MANYFNTVGAEIAQNALRGQGIDPTGMDADALAAGLQQIFPDEQFKIVGYQAPAAVSPLTQTASNFANETTNPTGALAQASAVSDPYTSSYNYSYNQPDYSSQYNAQPDYAAQYNASQVNQPSYESTYTQPTSQPDYYNYQYSDPASAGGYVAAPGGEGETFVPNSSTLSSLTPTTTTAAAPATRPG
jgi:hypothetical protein